MKAVWWLALTMTFTFPLLTGCWDRLEIEDRGTILGLAVDPVLGEHISNLSGPAAKSDARGYKLTAQVAIPGRIPLGPGEGGTGSPSEKPVWVVSATGKTIQDAMNGLQQQLADKVFLGHLRVILVNQQLANTVGIVDIQDFLRRNAEIRRLAWLVVSKGAADKAMEAAPKLERVPTLYLVGTLDHAVQMGKMPNLFLGNYWSVYSAKGQEPLLPYVSVRDGDVIRIEGLAAFRGGHMVGALDPLETASYMEMTDQRRAGYGIAYPMPGDPEHSVILRGTNRRSRTRMHHDGQRLSVDVYSRIEVNIEEKTGTRPVDTAIPQIADEASQAAAQGQLELVKKTQGWKADIFGIGEYVRGRDPELWKTISTREKWEEIYATLPFRTHVKVYIRRSGMSAR